MLLAYHDKNYLSRALTGSPKLYNETVRKLIDYALEKLPVKDLTEIKPCPFCGGEAKLVGKQVQWVDCGACGARGQAFDGHPADAIDAWDKRSNLV